MTAFEYQLIEIWERGYNASLIERAVLLSYAANPNMSVDEILDLPIGLRDGRLIQYRSKLFGSNVTSTINCPGCETKLELAFNLIPMIELIDQYSDDTFFITWEERQVEVRHLNTRDIADIAKHHDAATSTLLRKCFIDPSLASNDSQLSSSLCESIATSIEQHDPLGNIEFPMQCTECRCNFESPFDIASFLWSELNAWCQRLVGSIHTLARSYGWSEAEILDVSPWRRQVYLNMIRQ